MKMFDGNKRTRAEWVVFSLKRSSPVYVSDSYVSQQLEAKYNQLCMHVCMRMNTRHCGRLSATLDTPSIGCGGQFFQLICLLPGNTY